MDHWPMIKMCLLLLLFVRAASCPGAQNTPSKTSDETVAALSSESSIPLATRLARARAQAKTSAASDTADDVEAPSRRRIDLDGSLPEDLWSGRVTLPQTNQDVQTSAALKHLIRQVRSVKFEEKTPRPTFTPPEESQPPAEAGMSRPAGMDTQNPASSPAAPMTATAAVPAAATTLPAGAQKTLSILRQNPTQVRDPLEMAELLFLSGQAGEAAPFYARALQSISRDDPNYDADRAWILFQLGNCLRESDIAKAQEVYMKLVSEYPASPWTELAKAHGRLLTWYHKDRPEQLATSPRL